MSAFEKFQKFIVSTLLAVLCFYGGYYFGVRGYIFEVRKNPPKIQILNRYPADKKVDFSLFWTVWDKVNAEYLNRPVDPQKMLYGAISGMVASLDDPYTAYLPPDINKSINEGLNGSYQGIGAELGFDNDKQLIIVSPLDGSPALSAGLKPGDKILKINDDSTLGISLSEAVSKIKGSSGTKVTLFIQSGTNSPRNVEITRGVITSSSVSWKDKGNGTAYIRISQFGTDTNDEWSKVVSQINTQMRELDSVVIDLRNNPGGYLQSAVFISGEFFKDKPVVFEENALGKQTPLNSSRIGSFTKVPKVYVLINSASASASEILAAALKDNYGATLIGTKSYGKGTIQSAEDFSDGSGVHITIAKWLTPKKIWVHKVGIEPDVKVEVKPEDVTNGTDPQLDKALELAKTLQ